MGQGFVLVHGPRIKENKMFEFLFIFIIILVLYGLYKLYALLRGFVDELWYAGAEAQNDEMLYEYREKKLRELEYDEERVVREELRDPFRGL